MYYNIGNARVKAGDYGRAILAYRKAKLFRPRDPWHTAALNWAAANATTRLVTTDEVLTEFFNAMAAAGPVGRAYAAATVHDIRSDPNTRDVDTITLSYTMFRAKDDGPSGNPSSQPLAQRREDAAVGGAPKPPSVN